MTPPAAVLQDSVLHLGRSSLTAWKVVMVQRLGVVEGHAEIVWYTPVLVDDMVLVGGPSLPPQNCHQELKKEKRKDMKMER